MPDGKWTVETNLYQTYFLALLEQNRHSLLNSFTTRSHHYDHTFRVWRSYVFKEVVTPAGERSKLVHFTFHDVRRFQVQGIRPLARLKENIGILRSSAHYRTIRRQRTCAVRCDQLFVHHLENSFV